jgi:hypothetical protein
MSVFTQILEKLGLKKPQSTSASPQTTGTTATTAAKPAPPTTTAPSAMPKPSAPAAPSSAPSTGTTAGQARTATPAQQAPAAPKAISEVDVVKQLEEKARGSGLDWKVSIVDLLKLLGIDSSREARNELAQELGCPPELMKDSAKMNTWLHKEVLRKIAENGGNIPQSLLD